MCLVLTSYLILHVSFFRIVISVQAVSGPVLEEALSGDSSPDSLSDTCPMFKQEPSPFSSKPVMYDKEEVSKVLICVFSFFVPTVCNHSIFSCFS